MDTNLYNKLLINVLHDINNNNLDFDKLMTLNIFLDLYNNNIDSHIEEKNISKYLFLGYYIYKHMESLEYENQ